MRFGAVFVPLLTCLVLVTLSGTAAGRTWHVPSEAQTIQAAVDSSHSGDEILIAPGLYRDCTHANYNGVLHCVILDSGVSLRGETGNPGDVIIAADSLGRVIECRNLADPFTIEGVTLRGGLALSPFGSGGGVFCYDSDPTFTNCVFVANHAEYAGGGIYLNRSEVTLSECVFDSNSTDLNGAAIRSHSSTLTISNCTIRNSGGVAVHYSTEAPQFDHTIISGSTDAAIARNSAGDPVPTLTCCDLHNNDEDYSSFIADQNGQDGNISIDPLFCNPFEGDLSLYAMSHCAESFNPDCGRIGALPVGCGVVCATWNVHPDGGGDLATIQDALDAAAFGDTISLHTGTFSGDGNRDLEFRGKGVIVTSHAAHPDSCVIDCGGAPGDEHRGFHFHEQETAYSRLSCVSVTGGNVSGDGGGILCESSPVIVNCVLYSNHADRGGGIFCDGASPQIDACVINNNEGRVEGGAFACIDSEARIENTVMAHNWGYNGGAVYCVSSSSLVIDGCTIYGNNSSADRAAVAVDGYSSIVLSHSIITASNRGSAHAWSGSINASHCDVFGNTDFDFGGALSGQQGVNDNFSLPVFFCDESADDFRLRGDSPCVSWNTTDGVTIGARSFACMPPAEFSDVTIPPLNNADTGIAVNWIDYDNDENEDLYLINAGQTNRLLRNDGGGVFVDVTTSPVDDSGVGAAAAWTDYDNDGRLDLYLVNDGTANLLARNLGADLFVATDSDSLADPGADRSAAWGDYNGDGMADLILADSAFGCRLYRQEVLSDFADLTCLLDTLPTTCATVSWVDYDGDDQVDLYVTCPDTNNVLLRGGDTFTIQADLLDNSGDGCAAAWGDYDNDGDLDVYVVNSNADNVLYRNDGENSFAELSQGPLGGLGSGSDATWGDYDNDGDLDLLLGCNGTSTRLLRNCGQDIFVRAADLPISSAAAVTGAGWADYDGDGDLDLYLARSDSANHLLRNDAADGHWLLVDLVSGTSQTSIGARVRVVIGDTTCLRVAGLGAGGRSTNAMTLHFGLGAATTIDTLTVQWRLGDNETLETLTDLAVDQRLSLSAPAVSAVATPAPVRNTFRLLPCSPNPGNPGTTVYFDLPIPSSFDLRIYDIAGRLVKVLSHEESRVAGRQSVFWNGRDDGNRTVASGVYFVRLQAGRRQATVSVTLVK